MLNRKNIKSSDAKTEEASIGFLKRNWTKRRLAALIAVCLLMGVAVASYYYLSIYDVSESTENYKTVGVCSEDSEGSILRRASEYIDPVDYQKLPELKELTEEIEHSEGYVDDQNCLYILTIYYINVTDSNNARRTLDELKEVYDSQTLSSLLISNDLEYVEELESQVGFIEEINSEDLGSPSFADDPNDNE